jgi:hypothetical protein
MTLPPCRIITRVTRLVRRFIATLELSRLPVAFGAVANVWVMVFIARADPALTDTEVARMPLTYALCSAALLALGFMTFGAALNDFLDAKHDRAFAPDRPIPSGSVKPQRAIQIAAASLCIGLLGAIGFGTSALLAAMALAAIVLVYDAFGKHVPALGLVLAGLASAASMLVPCVSTPFTLPIWIAMSQSMGLGAIAYVAAEKRPKLTPRAVAFAACSWVVVSCALMMLATTRNLEHLTPPWVNTKQLLIPAVTVIVCAAFAAWKLRGIRGARASEKLLRYGSLWKSLVAASWLLAIDLPKEAAIVAAIALAIFVTFALLREAGPQLAEPVSWRS